MFCHFYFKHQECYSLNQLKWPGGRSSLSKSLYMIVDNPAAKMPKYVTFTKTSRAWLVPPNRSIVQIPLKSSILMEKTAEPGASVLLVDFSLVIAMCDVTSHSKIYIAKEMS